MKEKAPENSPDTHKAEIVDLLHGQPQVLHLLSGGIWKNAEGRLRITKIGDGELDYDYQFGLLDGIYPMLATVELAKLFPESTILTTSHSAKTEDSHAKIYADALKTQGISGNRIVEDSTSIGTKGELVVLIEQAVKNNWNGPIALVVNDWHMDRTVEMFARLGQITVPQNPGFEETLNEFTSRNIQVLFANAEQIFGIFHPKFTDYYENAKKTEPLKSLLEKRLFFENRGTNALREGKY